MKTTYERTVKDLYLEDSVETYRTYLIGGFMVMEFVCTNWLQIDLGGFTTQQMIMMHKYERLLIELGEKSRDRWGLNLPVEVRLIGFILLQAGLFYLGKIISEKGGTTIAELFKAITGQPPASVTNKVTEEGVPKKMRGPSIKVNDIKKMSEEKD
jgi:hypothetical protein